MKKLLLYLFLNICFLFSFSQDSCLLRISLLTCAPGQELYSTFGHTALRVQDQQAGTDKIYNYGTFNFSPDFYSKFIRGKLLYFLSVENFEDFMYNYQVESRSVQEQVLQLTCSEKQRLLYALDSNAQTKNRYYRYDFLFDNCTTRAGEMVEKNTSARLSYRNILPRDVPSFRQLIHSYLDAGHQYWSKLGIDILLGVKLDRRVTNRQAMFLPDYLLKGFDSASLNGHPLAKRAQTILPMPSNSGGASLFTPFIVFCTLLLLSIFLMYTKKRWADSALSVLDFLLFFMLGLTGLVLLFMWFGTDHTVCRNNYNLLWALPTHVVAAFFVSSRKKWSFHYYRFVFILALVLLVSWWFLPQQMNNALLPVVILIALRARSLYKRNDHAGKTG